MDMRLFAVIRLVLDPDVLANKLDRCCLLFVGVVSLSLYSLELVYSVSPIEVLD